MAFFWQGDGALDVSESEELASSEENLELLVASYRLYQTVRLPGEERRLTILEIDCQFFCQDEDDPGYLEVIHYAKPLIELPHEDWPYAHEYGDSYNNYLMLKSLDQTLESVLRKDVRLAALLSQIDEFGGQEWAAYGVDVTVDGSASWSYSNLSEVVLPPEVDLSES